MQSNLLNTTDAAQYLCVSKAFLERDRWDSVKIPFIRVGSRGVRYDIEDLDRYIAARRQKSRRISDVAA